MEREQDEKQRVRRTQNENTRRTNYVTTPAPFHMGVTDREIDVDHEDHDGLNCQRCNLRKCVRGENDGNRRKTHGSSQYKGVSWSKDKGKWRACITIEKTVHLGYFTDET